jgi:hypothetical protein
MLLAASADLMLGAAVLAKTGVGRKLMLRRRVRNRAIALGAKSLSQHWERDLG